MSQSVSVLLLDDGELDDVQALVESMQIPFGRVRGASIVPGMQSPSHLLISTPRRIEAVTSVREHPEEGGEPVRIMVTSEDSNALRAQLRNVGFDFLVRRPVHPEALRLLILHAMYRGEEQRAEPRVAVGFDVTFKSGLISRQGTLVDLSMRGCRLLANRSIDPGKRIKVQIPEALGASETLALKGRVIRTTFDRNLGKSGLYAMGVMFEKVSPDERNELEWILEERSKGPPRTDEGQQRGDPTPVEEDDRGIRELPARNLRNDPRFEANPLDIPEVEIPTSPRHENEKPLESVSAPLPPLAPPASASVKHADLGSSALTTPSVEPVSEASDRRNSRRATFAAKVPAFGSRALRVLVGRDLSVGGMRVETNPDIAIGDRLHLAIYGSPNEEPLLVWATAERSDDDHCLGLVFDELEDGVAAQLERLVVSLPAVESLNDSETEAMGTVISEVLPPEPS
jgi:CheY-like chemotaxis protein